jgi:hypothetical protein
MRFGLVMFHSAFVAPHEILQPADGGIEAIANGDIDVGMRQVQLAAPIDPDRAAGDREVDSHYEEALAVMMLLRRRDHHAAARDAAVARQLRAPSALWLRSPARDRCCGRRFEVESPWHSS